ncbi:MAG: hypothetical protein WC565_09385 [Parcubacteria group bacterium]
MKKATATLHGMHNVVSIQTVTCCHSCYLTQYSDGGWGVHNLRGYLLGNRASYRDALRFARAWGQRCAGLGLDTPGEIDKLWPEVRAWLGKEVTQ